MTRAEPLHAPAEDIAANDNQSQGTNEQNLRDAVTASVRQYLSELDGQLSTDVYQMVLAEMEAPLLEEIMAYTRNNQTKASVMLGLNRGTLRKKLKQYNLIGSKD
ncbi:DNA-binding transcriptional regulator Fis [Halioglobus maricola]|uniref:Putative Fis-like DNA-binding protein n=1 Tax=Halioglobus maricola TaxID=2601894 RepID=A0A5P9NFD4_9GAMM|nr:DNA-binding transcriptional regulator Fis [Halioglobus maricola]QFU74497.1 DNA-binding transcriptional regulator Fis [Halioglobus maricola]